MGILISIGAFYIGDRLVPYSINQIYTMRDDIRRTKSEIKIPTGTFYDGIEGYILRVEQRDKETGMMYNIQVYDHNGTKGNTRITVADSGLIKMSKSKDYLTFSLYSGISYTENNTRKYRDTTLALQRVAFSREEMVIPLENYAYHQSDSARYGEQVKSMNLKNLRHGHDSLSDLVAQGARRHVEEFLRMSVIDRRKQLDTSWRKPLGLSFGQKKSPGERRFRCRPVCQYGPEPDYGIGRLYEADLPHRHGNLEKVCPGAGLYATVFHRSAHRRPPQERRYGCPGRHLHALFRAVLGGGHHR